ncbi:hypothetical protein JMUB6875_46340 [Nocardia sp. JMUB6875]|uniref:hypothetical protein n=1 Tax=Nocardia sp. JMUB6875 TaxID=3158170 RepID=UPI0032E567F6
MPEPIKPPDEARVFDFTVRSAADAALKFRRIRAAQDLIDRGTEEYRSAPALFSAPALHDVAGPAPIMPKMPDPKLPETIDQKTNPAPAAPAPQPQPQPAPQAQQQPQPQPPASQNPVGTSDPAPTLADLGLGGGVQTAPPPVGSADDLNTVLVAGPPAPGQTVALPSGNTTVTTGADQTTIIGTTDPVTGHNKTDVLDRNGLLIATAESDIVLGSGGLSRDTTITSIGGAVTQVRSVDDGYGHLTTWTANPDGSHSVRYADGTVIKEPAPGSKTPAEIVQLDPDGLGGHVTEYNLDGTTTEADFRPGVLGAPVTVITGPDGDTVQVVTVPGRTNGAPYSIITNPDLTRVVLQPDGITVPIDRYNDMIGGPNYGNQFDPLTGTWRSDPVTARGPIITASDGTSTQDWTYKNRKGEQRTATATFDKNGNLTALQSGDYTGFDSTTFKTFDGITVPVWSGHADAGNVTDDSRLYWDAILTVSGLPELGYRAGLMLGARLIARELAAKGISETGIQLATSTLITRGATSFTGLAGTTTRLDRSLAGVSSESGTANLVPRILQSAKQSANAASRFVPSSTRAVQGATSQLASTIGRQLVDVGSAMTAKVDTTIQLAFRNLFDGFGGMRTAPVGVPASLAPRVVEYGRFGDAFGGPTKWIASKFDTAKKAASSMPDWVRKIVEPGNVFNRQREPIYASRGGANEVHVEPKTRKGQYRRVDSYVPGQEIVSRKFTQLADITPETAIEYLRQLERHYKPGTKIANTPTNVRDLGNSLIGTPLIGRMILEVPVQARPVPATVLKEAVRLGIRIRDVNGKIY